MASAEEVAAATKVQAATRGALARKSPKASPKVRRQAPPKVQPLTLRPREEARAALTYAQSVSACFRGFSEDELDTIFPLLVVVDVR